MNSEIKKVLNKIEKNGFEAYVVGGFVRDYLLCRKSNDVDICSNALPKEIQNIFGSATTIGPYGSFNLKTNHFNYDITTYRKEKKFIKRNPTIIEYTNNLLEDLQRRDFTMNAICMNQKGHIINLMSGVEDLECKEIKMIGNPNSRIKDDPLRILRAIRFSTTLDLRISTSLWNAMEENKQQIMELSKERIKQELDGILISPNFKKGLNLLNELGMLKELGITDQNISYVNDLNGMWAQIHTEKILFTKNEKQQILAIQKLLEKQEITPIELYDYGLYTVMIVAKIKGIKETDITKMYKKLTIESRKYLKISFETIQKITKESPENVAKIERDLIEKILLNKIKNKKDILIKETKKYTSN